MRSRFLLLLAFILSCRLTSVASTSDSLSLFVKSRPWKVINQLEKTPTTTYSKVNDLFLLASAYENVGHFYKVDSLLEFAFNKFNFKEDSALYINFLRIDARNKKVLDMFDESIAILQVVLNYVERKGDKVLLADVYLQFAEYYRAADNFEMACLYLDKARGVGMSIKGGLPPILNARLMNRKAAVFLEHNTHLDSVELFSKAVISIAEKHRDYDLVASSCNELGYLYMTHLNKDAKPWLLRAIRIWDSLGFDVYSHNSRLHLARWHLKKKESKEAIKLADENLKTVIAQGWLWYDCHWYEVYSQAYEQLGDYKNAFIYLNKAKEKLVNTSRTQYIRRLAYYSNKLELKHRENELREVSTEINNARLELENKSLENKFLFSLLMIASLLLFGFLVYLAMSNKQGRKDKEVNRQLQQLVSQKEVLLQEVNHRVKNNLSLLSGIMYLKERDLKDEASLRTLREMNSRINTIGLIHETLYQRDDVESINFQQYLERLSTQVLSLFPEQGEIDIDIQCDSFCPPLAVAIPLSLMINELFTNSLKHAFKNVDRPQIQIVFDAKQSLLTYSDNGPGYDLSLEKGSFGKMLLSIFATQINAKLIVDRDNGRLFNKIYLEKKKLVSK